MRTYLAFGGDDKDNLRILGPVEGATHDQAQNNAADEYPGFVSYGTTPIGNWKFQRYREKMVREWEPIEIPGQITIDEIVQPEPEPDPSLIEKADDLVDRAEAAREKAKAG